MLFLALLKLHGMLVDGSEGEFAGDEESGRFSWSYRGCVRRPIATAKERMTTIHVRTHSFRSTQFIFYPPQFSEQLFSRRGGAEWLSPPGSSPHGSRPFRRLYAPMRRAGNHRHFPQSQCRARSDPAPVLLLGPIHQPPPTGGVGLRRPSPSRRACSSVVSATD